MAKKVEEVKEVVVEEETVEEEPTPTVEEVPTPAAEDRSGARYNTMF